MKNFKFVFIFLLALLTFRLSARAQNVAVKTNVLYDALANINWGVEAGLAPQWSLDISGNFNAWSFSHGRRWKHWFVQPEARYWLCDRFAGHFFGFHAHVGQFNVGGLKNGRKHPTPTGTLLNLQYFMEVSVCRKEGCDVCF